MTYHFEQNMIQANQLLANSIFCGMSTYTNQSTEGTHRMVKRCCVGTTDRCNTVGEIIQSVHVCIEDLHSFVT